MAERKRISIEWLSGCSGCEVALVDLHERLLSVLEEVDLVRLPILLDTKEYVEADIGIVTGCVRTEHDIEAARLMRRHCRTIVAYGTCPVYGGPQGAAYAHTNHQLLERAFTANSSTTTHQPPADVPPLLEEVRPLDAVIEVDRYLPGCPPHPAYLFESLMAVARERPPRIGRRSVCFSCPRTMSTSDVHSIRRHGEEVPDQDTCFLSQGYLCFGSVTLDRCQSPCPRSGVPCFSCGGPTESIVLEPQKDVRTEVATRMAHLTHIPYDDIVAEIERQAKTHFAYAMASPVFRQKPTFLLKKWLQPAHAAR
jgi:F420-non-reducing hydrogenase small subunit